jgi:hypothetical protein
MADRSRLLLTVSTLSLTAMAALGGCVETFDGNGVAAEEIRAERDFDRVSSRGVLEVSIAPGDFSVGLHIDENLLEHIDTFVSGDTLVIEVQGGNIGDVLPGPHVIISMPSLVGAELRGTGKLTTEDFDEEGPVTVQLGGTGEVSWTGSTPELSAVLNGGGEMFLDGSADRAEYYVSGAGRLDARELTAQRADVEISGSGNVQATVDGRVDARIEGTGSIELLGDVDEGSWDEGDGSIVAR